MSQRRTILIIIGISFLMTIRLGFLELSGEEPRRATIALEMLESGEYIVPHAYGLEYYNKPPVHNWAIALAISIFGHNEFAVRLPGIFTYAMMALVLCIWLHRIGEEILACISPLLLLSFADLLLYGSIFSGELDFTFSFFILLNAIGVFTIGKSPEKKSCAYAMAYGALAIAILTKGIVAVHFHLFALLAWSTYRGTLKQQLNPKHGLAILFAISILLVYCFFYHKTGNLQHLLLNNFVESSDKIVGIDIGDILNQVIETPSSLLKIALPWSLLAFFLLQRKVRTELMHNNVIAFSILYIVSNIWIYWIFIDVRDRYFYPIAPILAILFAGIILAKGFWPKYKRYIYLTIFILLAMRLAYLFIAAPRIANGSWSDKHVYRQLAQTLVEKSNGEPIDIIMPKESFAVPFAANKNDSLYRQPLLPYQLPFYLSRLNGHAPKHRHTIKPKRHYLIYKSTFPSYSNALIKHEFEELWFHNEVLLIQIQN